MIQNYKKKSIVIQACRINEKTEDEIKKWSNNAVYASPVLEPSEGNPKGVYWQVKTLEGVTTAIPGDYIVKGVNGEFYPVKEDIFQKTYETFDFDEIRGVTEEIKAPDMKKCKCGEVMELWFVCENCGHREAPEPLPDCVTQSIMVCPKCRGINIIINNNNVPKHSNWYCDDCGAEFNKMTGSVVLEDGVKKFENMTVEEYNKLLSKANKLKE